MKSVEFKPDPGWLARDGARAKARMQPENLPMSQDEFPAEVVERCARIIETHGLDTPQGLAIAVLRASGHANLRVRNAGLVAALEEAQLELQKHTARLCDIDVSTRLNFPKDSPLVMEATATWGQHMLVLEHIRSALAALTNSQSNSAPPPAGDK